MYFHDSKPTDEFYNRKETHLFRTTSSTFNAFIIAVCNFLCRIRNGVLAPPVFYRSFWTGRNPSFCLASVIKEIARRILFAQCAFVRSGRSGLTTPKTYQPYINQGFFSQLCQKLKNTNNSTNSPRNPDFQYVFLKTCTYF